MPVQRYLDAFILYQSSIDPHDGVNVMIPLPDDAPDTPAVLENPLPGLPGTWRRETAVDEHPAHYSRVDQDVIP